MRLVCGVIIGCLCCKFCRTGIDHSVTWMQFKFVSALHDRSLALCWIEGFETFWRETSQCISDVCVRETMALPQTQFIKTQFSGRNTSLYNRTLHVGKAFKAVEEPSCDACNLVHPFDRPLPSEGLEKGTHAPICGNGQPFDEGCIWQRFMGTLAHAFAFGFIGSSQWAWMSATLFKRRPCFEECFLEITSNRHDLAG